MTSHDSEDFMSKESPEDMARKNEQKYIVDRDITDNMIDGIFLTV